ncbi:4'-phosphopantetheinyl transferase superfamily protein [Rhodanobacter sp. DHG33]|uniref:4'-phosphopantetheinyl transferase family protein n=1 Tax=Rhodanobacter sp. DHG33 TaxID=2775921 RepID=UPI00177D2903|nr:4'-phosphopantetheinyl transferase superfamily protein [Rhodanobacter sp. DHG33]MBD8898882.1 4'-phosphopantetheinyl transferase superfamily protein [Rhodanobacter sp. DHG33]
MEQSSNAPFMSVPCFESVGLVCRQVAIAKESVPILAHIVEFLPDSFTHAAFAQAGIAYPESIQSSVYKRQAEFFFGRFVTRNALSMLGLAGEQVPIGAQRQPVWPSGVIGSITHTHGIAAAVTTWRGVYQGIGIDVEQVIDQETCQSVSKVVVGEHELDYLDSLQELSLQMALTIVFSAKESFYKAAYATVGRIFDFSVVQVVELDARKQRLVLVLNETLSDQFCRDQAYVAGFTFVRPDTVLTYVTW